MKSKKLFICLATATLLSTVSCGGSGTGASTYDVVGALGYNTVAEFQQAVLGEYDSKYQAGADELTDMKERYKKFAEAEYSLIYDQALIVPWYTATGYTPVVSRVIPHQGGTAAYGLTSDKLKNTVVSSDNITQEQRAKVNAIYEAGKGASEPTVDAEGYTSLANQHALPAVGADGKYTLGAGTENEVTFNTKKVFNYSYITEPNKDKFNYLKNTWTYNSYHYCNMVDGLVENDQYGNVVGAIATGYKVSKDGLTWTLKLRDDAKWIKNDGTEYGTVKADDFVCGIEYVLDATHGSGTAGIVAGVLAGAYDYFKATASADEAVRGAADFSKVGVKAIDDTTLEFKLETPAPYFLSMLTYSPFLPVSRAWLETTGADFGKTENDILVNGAFRISEHVNSSKIVYAKNPTYYDKDHVYVDSVVRTFIAGTSTPDTARKMFESGTLDSFNVLASDKEGYKKYVTGDDGKGTVQAPANANCSGVVATGSSTYIGYFNFNRSFWQVNDKKNKKSDKEKLATAKALLDVDFRKGFLYGVKVDEYLKMISKDPYQRLARFYTCEGLAKDADGKDYTEYVEDVYNEKNGLKDKDGKNTVHLSGFKEGSDPIYDITKAKKYFQDAKAALIASGKLTEKDFPIKIDVLEDMDVTTQAYEEAMYAKINEECSDIVKIQMNVPATDDQNTDWGSISNNYDFSMWSGWGPDYGDPNTFLHTFCVGGDLVEQLGF